MGNWPTISDFSGNAYDGTATNMEQADVAVDSPGGDFSRKSLLFDGVDEWVGMGNVLGFEYNQPFSVSCWFKTTDGNGYLVSKRGGSTLFRGYGLSLSGSGLVYFTLANDEGGTIKAEIVTTAAFADGAWHHVVATSSGSGTVAGMQIYVDDVLQPVSTVSDTLGGNTIVSTDDFNVASRTNGSSLHEGNLDEVAVYSDVLGAAEVTWIYNAGAPRDLLDGAAPDNLEAWWRMGDGVSWPQAVIPYTDMVPTAQEEDDHAQVAAFSAQPPVAYFRMRGIDQTCPAIQQPAYVYWTVQDTPDWLAALLSASDLPCGSDPSTDVVDIQVAAEWVEV